MSASYRHIKELTVDPARAGERLDKWLAGLGLFPSRSRVADLIDRGCVRMNEMPLRASYKLQGGEMISVEIPEPEPTGLQPLDAPLDIMYEDEDLIVINKPSGLVVHPAAGHAQDTLVNILIHHVGKLSMGFGENRPGIVHRLDRDTSGILVAAKNDISHNFLAEQFRRKTAHRMYWAMVYGTPPAREQTIRSTLARHPQDRKRFCSTPAYGKLAITHYRLKETLPSKISWLQCILETGRTHQIRVHLSEAGMPILGDPVYGKRPPHTRLSASIPRLALHACELGFEHPRSRERMHFHLGWPEDLARLAREAGFKNV